MTVTVLSFCTHYRIPHLPRNVLALGSLCCKEFLWSGCFLSLGNWTIVRITKCIHSWLYFGTGYHILHTLYCKCCHFYTCCVCTTVLMCVLCFAYIISCRKVVPLCCLYGQINVLCSILTCGGSKRFAFCILQLHNTGYKESMSSLSNKWREYTDPCRGLLSTYV